MIKRYLQFVREFVENSNSYIDARMQEIKDLIESSTEGKFNILYEWQNKEDHELSISFSTDELSIKYEFDIDSLKLKKVCGETTDFEMDVESIDDALEVIEKDICLILGVSEKLKN